jgi:hypothetical protein
MTGPEPELRSWGNTVRIRAEVLVTGGRTVTGELHLQAQASAHSGCETPGDALNRVEAFFPLTNDAGQTIFLAKSQVLAVSIAAGLLEDDPDRLSAARTIELLVQLSDGTEFTGTVKSELPPGRRRTLDFLNYGSGFFGMAAKDTVKFINRSHLCIATPLD